MVADDTQGGSEHIGATLPRAAQAAAASPGAPAAATSVGPGLKSFVDGKADGPTIVFVHGWPDDHTMWDKQVAHLKDRYRCVTTDLPGFTSGDNDDACAESWGYSIDEVVRRLEKTVETESNGQPIAIVAHDWGCTYSYMLEKKRPDLVSKIVAIDVGGAVEPGKLALFVIISYHLWLILAFVIGGPVGDAMAWSFARLVRAPLAGRIATASAGYPYYYWWKRKLSKTEDKIKTMTPNVPVLFLYGTAGVKKYMQFHADWWAAKIQRRQGSSSVAMTEAAHWVNTDQPDDVNRRLDEFFAGVK